MLILTCKLTMSESHEHLAKKLTGMDNIASDEKLHSRIIPPFLKLFMEKHLSSYLYAPNILVKHCKQLKWKECIRWKINSIYRRPV